MNEAELIAGIDPESVRAIRLNQRDGMGPSVLVDADDYEGLMEHRWHPNYGYAVRSTYSDGKRGVASMARDVMGLTDSTMEVDHINRNRLDNRKANLRVATRQQNAQNVSARGGSSEHRGVHWAKHANKWCAQGRVDGKTHHLGLFEDEQDAADAASNWRRDNTPFAADDQGAN